MSVSHSMTLAGTFALLVGCGGPTAKPEPKPGGSEEPSVKVDADSGGSATMPTSRGGADVVGAGAPPFAPGVRWLDGQSRSLESLRGKPLLVRFWTDTCPFCAATAPALEQIHRDYAERGLIVLGLFHPKPRGTSRPLDAIRARAKELGMTFPIGVDGDWATLDAWWLSRHDRAATSVSFVVDAQGVIRFVHPGPVFHPGDDPRADADYRDVRRAIEAVLPDA